MAHNENPFDDPELQALMKRHGIMHKPGLAAALMEELKPLLLADGVDLDNPSDDLSLDDLNAAMGRAVDHHNAVLFMPGDAERTRSLQVLYEFAEAFVEGGSEAAESVHDTVQPDATASRPAASHVMGTGLGLVDTWYTDAALAASLRNVPVGKWRGKIRKIATDLQHLARSGRAFDSLAGFTMKHSGKPVSIGIALLVASTVVAVAGRDASTIAETFTRLTGHTPEAPSQGTGAAFGLGKPTNAADAEIEAFAEWLTTPDGDNSQYVAVATEMLSFVQQLAEIHDLSISDADDIPDILDVLDEVENDDLRGGGFDVLRDYVTFQARESMFREDWESLIDLVDDAAWSNDPVNLVLEYAFETTMSKGIKALEAALASTTVVSGVTAFIQWLGSSQPVTGTGVLRRADIKPVAAMIEVAAEGVAKAPPVDYSISDLSDPNQPLPRPSVFQVLSMREVTPLNAWWETLLTHEIIELTTSRVRPGAVVTEAFHNDTPSTELAASLCSNYIAQVLTNDLLNEEDRPFFRASARAACEVAVDLLLQAISPQDEPAPRIAPDSPLHTMVRPRALSSLQYLEDAHMLTLTEGKVTVAPVMHGIIADGIKATLQLLEMVEYLNSLKEV